MALFWHWPKTLKSSLAPSCLCLCCYYEVWCGDWVKLVTSCWSKIFPTCPNYPMQSITLNVIRGKVTPEQVHREYPSDSLHPISMSPTHLLLYKTSLMAPEVVSTVSNVLPQGLGTTNWMARTEAALPVEAPHYQPLHTNPRWINWYLSTHFIPIIHYFSSFVGHFIIQPLPAPGLLRLNTNTTSPKQVAGHSSPCFNPDLNFGLKLHDTDELSQNCC